MPVSIPPPTGVAEKVFAIIGEYSKEMGMLNINYNTMLLRDKMRYKEETDNVSSKQFWQGMTVVMFATLSAGTGIAGACAAPASTPANPRLGANDGISDAISNTMKNLSNPESLKASSQFFNTIGSHAVPSFFAGTIAEHEAKRKLIYELVISSEQAGMSSSIQARRQADELALNLAQAKSKHGGS
jgi:hypothetical protein